MNYQEADEKNDESIVFIDQRGQRVNGVNYRSKNGLQEHSEPIDRYFVVYLLFVLHGIGTLIPWNMFITAESYFTDYKLNVNGTSNEIEDITLQSLRKNFLSIVGFSAQITNLICNALNIIIKSDGNSTPRILTSIFIEIIIIIVTLILSIVDTSNWPVSFFFITVFSIIIIYMATGVYQNSLFGVASKLPFQYPNAIILGSNISGTLTSLINILSLALSPDLATAAIYYFTAVLIILLACFVSYFMLPKINFFRYHHNKTDEQPLVKNTREASIREVISKAWPQYLNVFMVFFVTLSVFPAVLANIKSTEYDINIDVKYYTPVVCFLGFNLSALIGNFIPSVIIYPSSQRLWIPVMARFLFIPFFLFCNFNIDDRAWPVLFHSDIYFLIATILLGITSGYYSSLSMMYAPKSVDPSMAPKAGMLSAFFLVLGVFFGVNFSFVYTYIVKIAIF